MRRFYCLQKMKKSERFIKVTLGRKRLVGNYEVKTVVEALTANNRLRQVDLNTPCFWGNLFSNRMPIHTTGYIYEACSNETSSL